MSDAPAEQVNHAALASEIVGAYVAHNHVALSDMPALIRSVHEAISTLGAAPAEGGSAEPPKPAVPIKKSVTDDYIISLEDGRKFKSLKRHLATEYGMTPADYRAKWGLPKDYPMVAPAYAKARSELAKSSGLGRKATDAAEAAEPDAEAEMQPEPDASSPAPRRGRKKAD